MKDDCYIDMYADRYAPNNIETVKQITAKLARSGGILKRSQNINIQENCSG